MAETLTPAQQALQAEEQRKRDAQQKSGEKSPHEQATLEGITQDELEAIRVMRARRRHEATGTGPMDGPNSRLP